MRRTLVLEVTEETYAGLVRQAQAAGTPMAELAAAVLEHQYAAPAQASSERDRAAEEAARRRFRAHAGAASLGFATGADNESIDRDLAREYGNHGHQ
jgi:hypothetical protein